MFKKIQIFNILMVTFERYLLYTVSVMNNLLTYL